jgi:hypothetical protein
MQDIMQCHTTAAAACTHTRTLLGLSLLCVPCLAGAEITASPACQTAALQCIVRDGNNKVAAKYLQDMLAAIDRFEPKNAQLCFELVSTLDRNVP